MTLPAFADLWAHRRACLVLVLSCLIPAGCGGSQGGADGPEPTVTLTAAPEVVDDGGYSTLTWSAGSASSCAAAGGWSGTKPAAGSDRVGPLYRSTTFSLTCSGAGGNALAMIAVDVFGIVRLRWKAPTENVDGTPLLDLATYRIYYGEASGDYTTEVAVNDVTATEHRLSLPSGSYYFAMTAVDRDGNESGYSNEVLHVVD